MRPDKFVIVSFGLSSIASAVSLSSIKVFNSLSYRAIILDFSLLRSDSFHVVSDLKSIPNDLFTQGYRLVSFDVVSLFTNIPLERTVQIILDRIFKQNLTSTTLSKRPLKKLILNSCTKTIFSFNNTIFEQINGISMGYVDDTLVLASTKKRYSDTGTGTWN